MPQGYHDRRAVEPNLEELPLPPLFFPSFQIGTALWSFLIEIRILKDVFLLFSTICQCDNTWPLSFHLSAGVWGAEGIGGDRGKLIAPLPGGHLTGSLQAHWLEIQIFM